MTTRFNDVGSPGCTCKPNDPCYVHKVEAIRKEASVDVKPPLRNTGYLDIDIFLDECFKTMRDKGHDYRQGHDDDILHNFRTVANSVDSDMEKVWFTYFYKHYSAMVTYIKEGGQRESEPIEGRIKDQIVYLILFWKMVQEKKNSQKVVPVV